MAQIELGNITIQVEQKDIKNIHLSIHPPKGSVTIAAPEKMDLDTIRVFAISKLQWIKKQQVFFQKQKRDNPREYIQEESHYYLGKRYLLEIKEIDQPPTVTLKHSKILLTIRPNTSAAIRKEIIENWYRQELKSIVPPLIKKWEKKIGVKSNEFGIKKMRTKWGTCNIEAKRIWLNLELARKPKICLEYIIVHELIHLLERKHNDRFVAFMDKVMPKWRHHREELNRLPFSHLDWKY